MAPSAPEQGRYEESFALNVQGLREVTAFRDSHRGLESAEPYTIILEIVHHGDPHEDLEEGWIKDWEDDPGEDRVKKLKARFDWTFKCVRPVSTQVGIVKIRQPKGYRSNDALEAFTMAYRCLFDREEFKCIEVHLENLRPEQLDFQPLKVLIEDCEKLHFTVKNHRPPGSLRAENPLPPRALGFRKDHGLRPRAIPPSAEPVIIIPPEAKGAGKRKAKATTKRKVKRIATAQDTGRRKDPRMVAEYAREILRYERDLEVCDESSFMRPDPYYVNEQPELDWGMRWALMDWLVQVHGMHMLRHEVLFLAVNYIDRLLSRQTVSAQKLLLVGVTGLFLAAKYEGWPHLSVRQMADWCAGTYTEEQILAAERVMLAKLNYELGWPGPLSFLWRIGEADGNDADTSVLAVYFLEVAIMDKRFVAWRPSFAAAVAYRLAMVMLKKGDWSETHVTSSGYGCDEMRSQVNALLGCCRDQAKHHPAVFEKYQSKDYGRASLVVQAKTPLMLARSLDRRRRQPLRRA